MAALAYGLACMTAPPALSLVGPSSEDNSFAAHVVMVLKRGVNQAGYCTGVVLSPRIVLTAAHCVAAPADTRIFYRDAAGQPILAEVRSIARHPEYRPDAPAKRVVSIDLALIEAQTPLGAALLPAPLDDEGAAVVGEPLRIYGYGLAREGEGASGGVLRGAALRARGPLSKILLWAEDPSGAGAGGCTGDSGGPIVSADSGKVLAITTWSAGTAGKRCGALTQGPFVARQRPWIDSVLQKWGE